MRTLLGTGATGSLVREVQCALSARGLYSGVPDSVFGPVTSKGVQAFQQSQRLGATGIVDNLTWPSLMHKPVPTVSDRSIQLTSCFEGHGFGSGVGNFDGALLTWGIVGFTLASGSIQSIVQSVYRTYPEKVRETFGNYTDELMNLMTASRTDQTRWANDHTVGGRQLAEPWKTMFANFGAVPEVQQVQLKRVQRSYMQPAIQTAAKLGLASELGLALCYDIHVQNGGVRPAAAAIISQMYDSGQPEDKLRTRLAQLVADSASTQWRTDVLGRKMAIATGQGNVHGRNYILDNWGLNAQFPSFEVVAAAAAA